jgi:hypothetical protein
MSGATLGDRTIGEEKKVTKTARTSGKVVRKLGDLLASDPTQLVRIYRDIENADCIDGYVVAVGSEWIVVHVLEEGVELDGFCSVLLSDICRVQPFTHSMGFELKATRLLKIEPRLPRGVTVVSGSSVAFTFARRFGLIAVYIERDDPGLCFMGVPVAATDPDRLFLRYVDRRGKLFSRPDSYLWSEVTRLEAGNRYKRALARVALPADAR